MKKILFILFITIGWSCSNNSGTEKYQNKRDKIINLKEKVREIDFKDALNGRFSELYIINDYLLISDVRAFDKLINVFDKNTFNYISSIIDMGQGPGEIASIGFIGTNEIENKIFITDHGKQKIFSYNLDSVFTNPLYMPTVKMEMNTTQFPNKYQYINDTLSMGVMIEPTGNSGYNHSVAKLNFATGELKIMNYKHPEIDKKRVCLALSTEHKIYVECYHYQDLISIFDLNGDLKYNIYGKAIDNSTTNRLSYHNDVIIVNDIIITSYGEGRNHYSNTEKGYPTQFIIFSIEGDYIQTLETEYSIKDFCYDKDNNRIIMHLDEEIQFAYLSLDGIIF